MKTLTTLIILFFTLNSYAGDKHTISGTFDDGTQFMIIADSKVIKPYEIILTSGTDFEKIAILKSFKRKGNNTCSINYDDKKGQTFNMVGNCKKTMKYYEKIVPLLKGR